MEDQPKMYIECPYCEHLNDLRLDHFDAMATAIGGGIESVSVFRACVNCKRNIEAEEER